MSHSIGDSGSQGEGRLQGDDLLYLTDERLRQGIELMFFACRDLSADLDRILAQNEIGRAHHRALYFITHRPGLSVNDLLDLLGIARQSLNPVLADLVRLKLVRKRVSGKDRRQRLLETTPSGAKLEGSLVRADKMRIRRAYREAGAEAVAGFRAVLERLVEERIRKQNLTPVFWKDE